MLLLGLFGGIPGILLALFLARRARLNRDRDQHHLASMLISIAAGQREVSRADLRAWLDARNWSRGHAITRINHAVKLAGTAISGDLHEAVVRLAREIVAPS